MSTQQQGWVGCGSRGYSCLPEALLAASLLGSLLWTTSRISCKLSASHGKTIQADPDRLRVTRETNGSSRLRKQTRRPRNANVFGWLNSQSASASQSATQQQQPANLFKSFFLSYLPYLRFLKTQSQTLGRIQKSCSCSSEKFTAPLGVLKITIQSKPLLSKLQGAKPWLCTAPKNTHTHSLETAKSRIQFLHSSAPNHDTTSCPVGRHHKGCDCVLSSSYSFISKFCCKVQRHAAILIKIKLKPRRTWIN